jgi:hypothetical protein
LPKPQFLRCLYKEVSKPFYTYQTFLIWTWVPVRFTKVAERGRSHTKGSRCNLFPLSLSLLS